MDSNYGIFKSITPIMCSEHINTVYKSNGQAVVGSGDGT